MKSLGVVGSGIAANRRSSPGGQQAVAEFRLASGGAGGLSGGRLEPVIGGTGSYKSKVAGVPFSGKNVPVQIDEPQGTDQSLQVDWSLQLLLAVKTVKGKERIVASATLVLPNGDTIQFPEKAVKYSQTAGYKLSFKKGTNTTAKPDVVDAKSSVTLTGLKFVKNGDVWEPTAGTIAYKFLGQSGTENLLDFVAP